MPRCKFVGQDVPNVVNLTRELVRINSVPSADHGDAGKGEVVLANWLSEYLEDFDFMVNVFPVQDNRGNLMARHQEFNADLPTIAFEAHLDTVNTDGMTIDPFAAELRDGKVYGRGASDVKGTMAVMLSVMLHWYKIHAYNPAPFNLAFLATMGEEGGTQGARELVRRPIPFKMVLVGEPTSLQPVIGHNGTWRFNIITRGVSCHSSTPELGSNAIDEMARVIEYISRELKAEFETTPGNSMNMTLIQGGEAINIIPAKSTLTLDCRYRPGTPVEDFKNRLVEFCSQSGKAEYDEILLYPPFKSYPHSLLLSLLDKALKAEGLPCEPQMAPWYSDAGPFSHAGYDTILWGVGDMKQAHTHDEFIETEQLETGFKVLMGFLEQCKLYFE